MEPRDARAQSEALARFVAPPEVMVARLAREIAQGERLLATVLRQVATADADSAPALREHAATADRFADWAARWASEWEMCDSGRPRPQAARFVETDVAAR